MLYVDACLAFLAGKRFELGDGFDLQAIWPAVMERGLAEEASGIILVLVIRAEWLEPGQKLIKDVAHVRHVSADLELPLLDFFILDRFGLESIGGVSATFARSLTKKSQR